MLDAAEKDELRSLQARAYGRHGGLTDADLERLHELERARPARSGASLPPPEERRRTDADPLEVFVEADDRPAPVEGSGGSEQEATAPEPASPGRPLRRYWRALVAGAAVIAVAGMGIGGMLFGDRGAPAVGLTPEQQEWQNELLATAEYDPGSLRAVGVEEGVVAWYATKKGGELVCVILSDGRNTRPSCTTAAGIAVQGLDGQFRTPAGDAEREVSAFVSLDAEGDPAVTLSSQLLNGEVLTFPTYAPGDEQTAAELAEAGYDPNSLWVIGHDGDVPLWSAIDPVDSRQCLIYDGSGPDTVKVCDAAEAIWDGGSLVIERRDEASGEITRYEQVFDNGAHLVITKGIEPGDAPD